jgi:hypothetical protein
MPEITLRITYTEGPNDYFAAIVAAQAVRDTLDQVCGGVDVTYVFPLEATN